VCTGFEGRDAGEAPLAALRALGIRAVILFAHNVGAPSSVRDLTAAVQAALADDLPALIAVDQEGGRVARLRDGVVALPAMMALGATRDPVLARRAGRRLGADLRGLGINADFAPVLDLAVEPRNTVIGNRAFGDDPELVAAMGLAFARGLREGGVAPIGKHFPGHGATAVDSHVDLPRVGLDEATWRRRDLIPFARAVADGIPGLMTAHVVLQALDATRPATLSPAILTGVLRRELGFGGVVFSDCLEMGALGSGDPRTAPRALAAGVDCIVISHRVELAADVIAEIAAAVRDGRLARERLTDAANRVRALRASLRGADPAGDGADAGVGLEIARAAVTIVRGEAALPRRAAVTVVSFEEGEAPSLSGVLRRRGYKSEIMRVALEPREDEVDLLEMVVRGLGERSIVILTRRAHLHPAQAAAVARLLGAAPNAIVVSAREPYDAALFGQARNLVCIYDDTEVSLEGFADAATGRPAAVR
jgi:beta-N-acetylhexosaminidase